MARCYKHEMHFDFCIQCGQTYSVLVGVHFMMSLFFYHYCFALFLTLVTCTLENVTVTLHRVKHAFSSHLFYIM